jgi:hypothetical protein
MRTDSYGSERVVADWSQVILPKKLALRAIALRENKEYFIRPGYEDIRRAFVTTTYQPFKNTTLRAEGEYVHRRDSRPPTTMARDIGYMYWRETMRAGNPQRYDNRPANAGTAGRPPAPNFPLADGTTRAYSISAWPAVFIFPHNAAPNFTGIQDLRNTVVINAGDDRDPVVEVVGDSDRVRPRVRDQDPDDVSTDDAEDPEVEREAAHEEQPALEELRRPGGPREAVAAVAPHVADDEARQRDVRQEHPEERVDAIHAPTSASSGAPNGSSPTNTTAWSLSSQPSGWSSYGLRSALAARAEARSAAGVPSARSPTVANAASRSPSRAATRRA